MYLANNPPPPQAHIVGRVEHLLNQTEHILSRTESLDSNSHSAGIVRLLGHKEQLEHVERLLAQAEYAIWLEKRTAQQVSSHLGGSGGGSMADASSYGYAHIPNGANMVSPGFPSANSMNAAQCKDSPSPHDIVNNHSNSNSSVTNCSSSNNLSSKKISKSLEEESVVW